LVLIAAFYYIYIYIYISHYLGHIKNIYDDDDDIIFYFCICQSSILQFLYYWLSSHGKVTCRQQL